VIRGGKEVFTTQATNTICQSASATSTSACKGLARRYRRVIYMMIRCCVHSCISIGRPNMHGRM